MLFNYEKKTKTALKRCFWTRPNAVVVFFLLFKPIIISHNLKQHKLCTLTGLNNRQRISGKFIRRTACDTYSVTQLPNTPMHLTKANAVCST